MNPLYIRKHNIYFGICYLLLGMAAWVAAGYFVAVPRATAPPPSMKVGVDLPSCGSALRELGYTVSNTNGELVAFEPLTSTPREQLEKASVASMVCRLPMSTFCMGDACERPGLTLALRHTDAPNKDVVPAGSKPALKEEVKPIKAGTPVS